MGRDLYLHEIIDVVGENAVPYMLHTRGQSGDEKVNFQLLGTWYTMGITGRWPQCINIWEIPGGWDGWCGIVDRLNLQRVNNQALEGWWRTAYGYRTGGFDRLLAGAPKSPNMAELAARRVKGTLFVHELTTVRPGAALDYCAAIEEVWRPIARDHGHELVGNWEVLMHDTEVCTVWATSVESHRDLGKHYDVARGLAQHDGIDGDPRIVEWRRAQREFVTVWREELMTPCPGTLCGPDDWDAYRLLADDGLS